MKKLLTWVLGATMCTSVALAQTLPSALPTKNLKGQWTFDNTASPFTATVGNTLVKDAGALATEAITSIDGPTATNKAIRLPRYAFLRCTPGLKPNGTSDTLKMVNRYTMVYDFRINSRGPWRCFYQTDPTNTSDGELFIRSSSSTRGHNIGRGTPGYSFDSVMVGRWYRLVVVANLGVEFNTYLDGQLLHKGSPLTADGNQALESANGLDELLLFADEDGENGEIDIAEVALYDTTMSASQVASLGGYGSVVQTKDAILVYDMTNVTNPLAPSIGSGNLVLRGGGTTTLVAGPKAGYKAVQLKSGQSFQVNHDIPANGLTTTGTTNRWSAMIDFKLPDLAQAYDLIQTDTTNKTASELAVTVDGKAGIDTLGYSKIAVVAGAKWHRVIMSVEGGRIATYYLDGAKILQDSIRAGGRFSLLPASAGKTGSFLIGAQTAAGHPNMIEISKIQVWNHWVDSVTAFTLGFVDVSSDAGTGKGGSSVFMDGTDANMSVRIPVKPQYKFDSTKSYTIEAWVKPSRSWSGDPSIIGNKDWGSGGNAGWVIALDNGGTWQWNMGDGGVNAAARSRADIDEIGVINDDVWHHIAIVVDRATNFARAYQDGVLKKSTDMSAVKSTDTDLDVYVGQDGTGNYSDGYKYPGYIDEVRIWGAALDSTVLKAWKYNSENINAHPQFTELRGYWKFNAVVGDSTADASKYANWGTLKNGASLRRSDVALPVIAVKSTIPAAFELGNAYPNPFNPSTTIHFSLPFASRVTLGVFNVLGQQVSTVFEGQAAAGTHSIVWNAASGASQAASGVYFYRLTATGANNETFSATKKMVLTK